MRNCGLVSIITPSYNCGLYLEETIKSIQAQTYLDWELLIQDDCSTDGTPELVEKYKIERVPMTILNEKTVVTGVKTLEEMTEIVAKEMKSDKNV